jgi:hypothetical protein
LVSQCLKTFKTLIVEAVLTIVYSFAFCSLKLVAKGFPVDGCGDDELPGVLPNLSVRENFGVSPDVATANACVAATELIRRRDDREEVTTTPGRTFFN